MLDRYTACATFGAGWGTQETGCFGCFAQIGVGGFAGGRWDVVAPGETFVVEALPEEDDVC
jgi:hypothetical protein